MPDSLNGKVIFAGVFFALTIGSSTSYAGGYTADFTKSLPDNQSIIYENVNLSASDYFKALISDAIEKRRYAELYLLGVLDATEGTIWCDYKTFKTITIDEVLFTNFKKLTDNELNDRASSVIKKILSKEFPCGGEK